ncbi:hypothetical protein ARALYDRAFT_907646 [Arabidopsis lyrata subsp. lyrata]|uniref:Uncharacterized protein n=1 Tax=Arabidopsis lyrata subsp. lyrata TaxID=81972 RepID=D7LS70_ARALL|nr:hypothetical protein ARALYDRAFT_907646 [Arabidopsis lyrata subsp. lyrata]
MVTKETKAEGEKVCHHNLITPTEGCEASTCDAMCASRFKGGVGGCSKTNKFTCTCMFICKQ